MNHKPGCVVALLAFACGLTSCVPMSQPEMSTSEVTALAAPLTGADWTPTADLGYLAPDSTSGPTITPAPTRTPSPTETPFPTRIVQTGGQEVREPEGSLVVNLPSHWYAASIPGEMILRNFEEEGGGETMRGDPRIVIRLTIAEQTQGKDPATLVQDMYNAEIGNAAKNGGDAALIGTPGPYAFGGLSGYGFLDDNGPGAFTAYLSDSAGNGFWVQLFPTTSPAYGEALEILADIRFD